MKFPKLLIPFFAVVIPTVRFASDSVNNENWQSSPSLDDEEITSDESGHHNSILRRFFDSERFLRFAKHSSHRSHSSHSSHKSGSHSSHYSGSDCNGCAFADEEENENLTSSVSAIFARR